MGRTKVHAGLVGAVCAVLACGQPEESDSRQRIAELNEQGKQMNAALDRLEERFLADQAKVDLWQELRERHQHVSAVVAANAEGHLGGMLKHYEHLEAKWRSAQQKRRLTVRREGAIAKR